ncbi:MAG: amidohydrolase family protein [bacterium]|nr:amidohydrolase family protein [bacterium]
MVRIIDLECSLPRRANDPSGSGGAEAADLNADATAPRSAVQQRPGYGMANYGRIFRSRVDGDNRAAAMPMDDYVKKLAGLGIEKAIPFGASNEETTELLRTYPGRFLGLARLSPMRGMAGVRDLERLIREEGFHALGVSALVDCLPASDRRYYPLYAKAAELGVPVRIYSTMNYANDRPYDLGHPRNLDQVAMDFPELTIIGGLGGWPWVNDMVALVRRHPNLYLDTSAHRPKYLGQPGSGWEMLLQFGNTLIQDKVMVGLSTALIGQPHETLIQEYLDLPLKDSVKEKWLFGNAARVFEIE